MCCKSNTRTTTRPTASTASSRGGTWTTVGRFALYSAWLRVSCVVVQHRYEALEQEVHNLEGQLADYNLARDKVCVLS